jgi:hypothetical protein
MGSQCKKLSNFAMRMRGKNADFTGGSQLFLRLLVFIQVYQVVRVAVQAVRYEPFSA